MDALMGAQAQVPKIQGHGTLESAWRRSSWLRALPLHDAGGWAGGLRRLVVVSPHPDDEVLGVGGLIATARGHGVPVRVISVTDGEACYPGSDRWSPSLLRATRRLELAQALAHLQVNAGAIDTLAFGDGRIAGLESRLARELRGLLAPGDHVLTTWRGDGHPDHEASARAVEQAASGLEVHVLQFPVWAWHWMSASAGTPPLAGACRYIMSPEAHRAKQRALACFVSQRDSGDPAVSPILPPRVLARFGRAYEVLVP